MADQGRYQANKEKIRAYTRKHRAENREAYREQWRKDFKKYLSKEENRVKNRARAMVTDKGVAKQNCSIEACDVIGEAHHEDYTKPLEVIWLCKLHHEDHHHNLKDTTNG